MSLPDGEARFETIFAQAPFSMQLLSRDGRTLRVNAAWERLWNVHDGDGVKEWILSGHYNVLTDPQLAAKGITPLIARGLSGESVDIPPILYDPAELGQPGRARWVSASLHPIRDADGAVREVMLIHDDVTERFRSERALEESEQRLRLATDAARIGIWDWDIDRNDVTWTPEVYALHGMDAGSFGGRSEDFAARVHPDDVPDVWARIEHAVATETGFECEFRVRLPDGGDRWLSTSGRVYRGSDGGKRMVGAAFSIDAYKKAEEALRELDQRKDEFLAMLAHELRNPLAPIRAAAEAMLMSSQPETARKACQVITRQMTHVTKLVDDLIDVSRVTRGLITLDARPVDLAVVVHDAIEQAGPLVHSRRHTLRTSTGAQALVVRGDRARLIQIVANLLNNAARYTPDAGCIDIVLERRDAEAVIAVSDTGQGIEPELLPRIFELFSQGRQPLDRASGGLGIGLALVHRLVLLHAGRIEVSSDGPGRGSRFTVHLPLAEEPPPVIVPSVPGMARVSRKIVIVDDNQDAADTLAMLLDIAGHRTHVFYTATGALESALVEQADAFLLDIGLPDMNGLELAVRLRERNTGALFVAASGYGQPHDIERSRAAGFDHHLVKPITFESLAAVLAPEREASTA